MERCPTCGFDPSTVAPSDAAVTARSLPRRFRAALAPVDDEEVPAEVLEQAASALRAVAAAAEAVRPGTSFDRGDLASAAAVLADGIERLGSDEWAGPRGEAALKGVHEAVHCLRAISP